MQNLKHKTLKPIVGVSSAIFFLDSHSVLAADNCSDSTKAGLQKCLDTNPIVTDLNVIVNFLSAGVGIVVIATIIIGGIQYSLAGDKAEAVTKAKTRITNGLLALVIYILIFGFLQWVVPGGLFNS